MNTLFYGDNLDILRRYIKDESVDLIYLDPPFNSNRNYNVLFRDESGVESDAQITAFVDTWHWNESAEEAYDWLVTEGPGHVGEMIGALRGFVGTNQMMAYLVMMAIRLMELHRVLKPTGSLYLHCDPTASHYLKVVLDSIFSFKNYRNEIVWKRSSAHNSAKRWGPIHDTLLFYSKSEQFTWNSQFTQYDESYVQTFYRHIDSKGHRYQLDNLTGSGIRHGETGQTWRGIDVTAKGRHWMRPPIELDELDKQGRIYWPEKGKVPRYKRYLEEMQGVPIQDVIADIEPLSPHTAERLGYPTQKPLALLERIISASSNSGDVVLDPFCGCGTSIAAAQKLGRTWIGIDVTHLAVALMQYRLADMFGSAVKFEVKGVPEDLNSARYLAQADRYQFQWWVLSLIKAKPLGGDGTTGKKGSDKGIDGTINFVDDGSKKLKRVIVQVKSGKVKSGDIRDLKGTLGREKAQMAVFLTLEPPSKDMVTEAVSEGYYDSPGWGKKYPRIQILTVEALLKGASVQMPPAWGTFKQADRVEDSGAVQGGFDFEP